MNFIILNDAQLNDWEFICAIMWNYPGIKIYAQERVR
jgi:hypothetical protein